MTLEQIAKDNGRPMLLGRLVVDGPTGPRGSVKALLSPTLRRTTVLLWFIWYGLNYVQTKNDIRMNFD